MNLRLHKALNKGKFILLGLLIAIAQIGYVGWGNQRVHADSTTGTIYGLAMSNTSCDQPDGSTVALVDSDGDPLGNTTVGSGGSFQINNVPNGFSYTLTITPDASSCLLPYSMTLDVLGDTHLDTSTSQQIMMYSETTKPQTVTVDGRILLNGAPDPSGKRFSDTALITGTAGIGAKLQPDPKAGTFKVTVPPEDDYYISEQPFVHGTTPFDLAYGIAQMSPLLSISGDTYKVFNFDTGYQATSHTISVVDQCGNPLPDTQLAVTRSSTVGLGDNITADFFRNVPISSTDSEGESDLLTQTQSDGSNGSLEMYYMYDPSTGQAAQQTVLLPVTLPQQMQYTLTLPECEISSDTTPPTIQAITSPSANSDGWNNTDVTVTFNCTDNPGGSGIAFCSPPAVITSEGTNQSVTGTATDNAGNTSTTTASVNIDKTAPTVSNLQLSGRIVTSLALKPISITASVSDNLSGVESGEFYIDTDPGQGNGQPMNYANNTISASATIKGLKLGVHTIYVRTMDKAGNWSVPASETFLFL